MMHVEGITIFIPVYNEEALVVQNTKRLHAYMRSLGLPFEIVMGSNGSTDQTKALAQQICKDHKQIRYFHLRQKGVGAAFKQGVHLARYRHIVTVDMDLSIDLDFIPTADRLLNRYDVVVGSKVTGDQKRPYIRKAASSVFIHLAKFLLRIAFHDYSIAAKGYRTEVVRRYANCIDAKTFYVVEVVYRASRDGYRIVEAPVICHDMRESRFNLVHEGVYKFGHLFRLWLSSIAFNVSRQGPD